MLNNALAILLQALGAVLFFNRFVAGVALRILKKKAFDEADYGFQPTVTVVVPMYNEGAEIRRTLTSLLALDYPAGKLDIVVVDDCSSDDSFDHASAVAATSGGRLTVLRNKHNPGGPGHNWVKARYIDPAPGGYKLIDEEGLSRVFIPAKLTDNKILTAADPLYVARLKQAGSEQLVKAWLDGNWDIIDGAYFDCWSGDMVIRPFEIPKQWLRFRSFDWGSARPFSCGWWAVAGETYQGIPKGALVRYREWYGAKAANEGLKLTAEQVSAGIRDMEAKGEEIATRIIDQKHLKRRISSN